MKTLNYDRCMRPGSVGYRYLRTVVARSSLLMRAQNSAAASNRSSSSNSLQLAWLARQPLLHPVAAVLLRRELSICANWI